MGAAQTRGESAYKINFNRENKIGQGSDWSRYKILRKYDSKVCAVKISSSLTSTENPLVISTACFAMWALLGVVTEMGKTSLAFLSN